VPYILGHFHDASAEAERAKAASAKPIAVLFIVAPSRKSSELR
jgi:hypothetical protein